MGPKVLFERFSRQEISEEEVAEQLESWLQEIEELIAGADPEDPLHSGLELCSELLMDTLDALDTENFDLLPELIEDSEAALKEVRGDPDEMPPNVAKLLDLCGRFKAGQAARGQVLGFLALVEGYANDVRLASKARDPHSGSEQTLLELFDSSVEQLETALSDIRTGIETFEDGPIDRGMEQTRKAIISLRKLHGWLQNLGSSQ